MTDCCLDCIFGSDRVKRYRAEKTRENEDEGVHVVEDTKTEDVHQLKMMEDIKNDSYNIFIHHKSFKGIVHRILLCIDAIGRSSSDDNGLYNWTDGSGIPGDAELETGMNLYFSEPVRRKLVDDANRTRFNKRWNTFRITFNNKESKIQVEFINSWMSLDNYEVFVPRVKKQDNLTIHIQDAVIIESMPLIQYTDIHTALDKL